MGWRKRLNEIAANRPEKLHPIVQRARGLDGEPSWDCAARQDSLTAGGRPIHVVLKWLGDKSLLTSKGESALAAAERLEYESLCLTRAYVTPAAVKFLDRFYQQWYDTAGINFGIDTDAEFDFAALDALWADFKSK